MPPDYFRFDFLTFAAIAAVIFAALFILMIFSAVFRYLRHYDAAATLPADAD